MIINGIGVLLLAAYLALLLVKLDPMKREAYPEIVYKQLWWAWIPIVVMIFY